MTTDYPSLMLRAKRFIIYGLAALAVLTPSITKATDNGLGKDNCGNFLPASLCTNDIPTFIGLVANMMVGAFGVLFVVMITVAGAQMASAGDSPDRLKAAKSRLINAIVGLVLLISFRAIMAFFGINV